MRARKGELVSDLVTGNHFDKYRSNNPIHQALMKRFIASARELVDIARPDSVVEVGCGPGDLAFHLFAEESGATQHDGSYVGTDISAEQVDVARQRYPRLKFQAASAYELPFETGSADLVVACEVLEHLEEPSAALTEIARVTRGYAIISVPWEPLWRVLNVARGKYVRQLGNTPGHVQHFSRRAIMKLVGSTLDVIEVRRPFPWTMVLAKRL